MRERLRRYLLLPVIMIMSLVSSGMQSEPTPVRVKIENPSNRISLEFPKEFLTKKYEYRIGQNSKGEWKPLVNSMVDIDGLAPGDYQLEVRDGAGNEVMQVAFEMTSPVSAYVAWGIIVGILVLGAVLYKMSTRRQEQTKAELKRRIAEVEMKALRAQMSPHFIFNSLNSINRYIVKSEPETASAYLTKFAKLMRLILDNSNHKQISLEQEISALKLYIEMESMRFNRKFEYKLTVDDQVNPATFGLPPMIIQPFIENAIWHGLMQKDGPGLLQIHIQSTQDGIRCVVTDNGIGRKKAAELKSKSVDANRSHGMKITQDRLAMIGSANKISTIEIQDLYDNAGNAAGTKVILEIPRGVIEEY